MPAQVLCITCGYDLRTLDHRGDCPECGTPIERSIHGDWLRYANEPYLRRLTRGLRWLTRCRAAFFWVFLSMLCMVFSLGFISISSLNVDIMFERVLTVLFGVASTLLALLFLATCITLLIISRADPARERREATLTVLAPCVIAGSTVAFILWILLAALTLPPTAQEVAVLVCYLAAWAGMAVMPKISLLIEQRCREASADRLLRLRRPPWSILILAGSGLALYWLGFCSSRTASTMPMTRGQMALLLFTLLAWIIAMGTFTTTREAVEVEISGRPQGCHS